MTDSSDADQRLRFLFDPDATDDRPDVAELLSNLKQHRDRLQQLLDRVADEPWVTDLVYRFWHHSFKVYDLQNLTVAIVAALREVAPTSRPGLNGWFEAIVAQGTGRTFQLEDNQRWLDVTRPMLEAFWHARFFLQQAVRYADLDAPPALLPSGWAALLYLYDLR